MPLIHYRPNRGKSNKKNEAVEEAYRDELKSQGLDDQSITSIHSIVRADHVDPQVSCGLRLLSISMFPYASVFSS
jgi:ATP-dependent RNA helicase DHX57